MAQKHFFPLPLWCDISFLWSRHLSRTNNNNHDGTSSREPQPPVSPPRCWSGHSWESPQGDQWSKYHSDVTLSQGWRKLGKPMVYPLSTTSSHGQSLDPWNNADLLPRQHSPWLWPGVGQCQGTDQTDPVSGPLLRHSRSGRACRAQQNTQYI